MSDQNGSQSVTMSDRTGSQSALRQVAASRLFLGATIAMCLSGLGASAAAPQIVLFLVKELGASLPLAGFYYLTSLAAPVAGYFVGRYSDHTGNRLGLFRMCAAAGFSSSPSLCWLFPVLPPRKFLRLSTMNSATSPTTQMKVSLPSSVWRLPADGSSGLSWERGWRLPMACAPCFG